MGAIKRSLLKLFTTYFVGKKRYQRIFNFTRQLSIQGLNFGNGGSEEFGGEIVLLKQLGNKYVENRPYIIFDVGANEGNYATEIIGNVVIKDLQIWCFEPSKSTFQKLQSNHGLKSNVYLNNIGFSNKNETLPLYISDYGSDISSLFPLEKAFGTKEKLSEYELVTIKKIDDFIIENDIPYIDLLKLDIEGNELNALSGASDAIKSGKIKSIQFEFGTCNIDSRTYFRDFWYLLSEQYNIYRLLKDGLHPITYYSESDEVFATINYYAELK